MAADTYMQADFFQPFVDGTLHTLKIQCFLEAKPGKSFIKTNDTADAKKFAIAGVVGITSPKFSGSISILFTKTLFLKIMGNMLGESYDDITPDLCDGAGELLNIIFGQAKMVLSQKGYEFQMAIPSVVFGQQIQSQPMRDKPVLVLPFVVEQDEFHVEIAVIPTK